MVMETPGPQEVGREFVRQYYTMLHEAPLHLHRFYSNNSAFVHGGVEKAGHEQPPVIGQEAIHKKIVSLNFNDCHAKIRQVDAQATVEDSVVVQVTGELSNNGEPMRRFMQTFVLVPQTPKKFYVHNDIFRYQDEVFHEEEGEAEETERFITDPREDIIENGDIDEQVPASPEMASNYFDQVSLSNGTTSLEVESLKATEPAPVLMSSPPQVMKSELDAVADREVSHREEVSVAEVDKYEHKTETKSVPVTELPQPDFHEPQPEIKPVTWAALASKNTPGGMAPPASNYTTPAVHVSKTAPARSELPKTDGIPSQAPQTQRVPRAPRERLADRDKNSVSRGDADVDADSINGRRSNSVGGGSKYSDNQQLFVGNLPHNITEKELKEFFEKFGKVEELRINTKSGGGKVPNFGFVVFDSADTVQDILKYKASQPIKYNGEHRLNVEEKKPRSSDGMRGGGGGSGRGGNSRGGSVQGLGSGRPGGQSYGDRGGRGGIKSLNNRQEMRGSPSLGPRGGLSQGRR